MSLSPPDAPTGSFYLQPARKPTSTCWYSHHLEGHHAISATVARLCRAAGMTGFKTNHSLRATSTGRLYQSSVDEQLIMEGMGHQSLTGIRSYKHTSDEQREALSDILNGGRKWVLFGKHRTEPIYLGHFLVVLLKDCQSVVVPEFIQH